MAAPELTILLMLKDRTAFTFRWMSYHNHLRFPFRVLVADGGSDERVQHALSTRQAYPHVDFEYVRYPHDSTYADFHAKMADALSRVRTPLVALADNDDLFVVSGVRTAVDFMQRHTDYSTCGGQSAAFWIEADAANRADRLYGSRVTWKASREGRSLTGETAADRLRNVSIRVSDASYYHIRRTEDVRRHFTLIHRANPRDPFLAERMTVALAAVSGKTKQLDQLYIARQWNPPESAGRSYAAAHGDWLGRMLAPTWSEDFTSLVDVVSAELAAQDRIPEDEARRTIIEAAQAWLAPHVLTDVVAEPTVTLRMVLGVRVFRTLLRLSRDHVVRRAARRLYRRAQWISVDAIHGTEWRSRHVPEADRALKPILEFLGERP